jgi:hypothetical protein
VWSLRGSPGHRRSANYRNRAKATAAVVESETVELDEKRSSRSATQRECLLRKREGPSGHVARLKQVARRGNTVATLAPPDASDASAKPHKMDDLHAGGRILPPCTRLRALWASRPVVVRVHSSAWTFPASLGFFGVERRRVRSSTADCGNSVVTRGSDVAGDLFACLG